VDLLQQTGLHLGLLNTVQTIKEEITEMIVTHRNKSYTKRPSRKIAQSVFRSLTPPNEKNQKNPQSLCNNTIILLSAVFQ
jgi:ABC-type glutathione transport system ATPase component